MATIVLSAEYHHQPKKNSTHYHDCHQIIYIAGGSATIRVNDRTWDARTGSLVVFSRYEHHRVTATSPDYRRFVLDISPQIAIHNENCYRIFSLLFNRPEGFRNVLALESGSVEAETLLRRIVEEKQSGSPLSEEMLDILLQQLLICVYRRFPDAFSSVTDRAFETVYRLQNRFETDFKTTVSLDQLAKELDMSVSYLSHQFKQITGSSVMGYLTACRIAAAKKHLANSALPVGEIVELCGFSDSSNFSRLFKKQAGCSPSQFRKKYK